MSYLLFFLQTWYHCQNHVNYNTGSFVCYFSDTDRDETRMRLTEEIFNKLLYLGWYMREEMLAISVIGKDYWELSNYRRGTTAIRFLSGNWFE